MKTIIFTEQNKSELEKLIANSVLNRVVYCGQFGQEYTVWDLVNTANVSSLRVLSEFIQNKISKLSTADEWVENPHAEEVEKLTIDKRLISLIIGWKLYNQQLKERTDERNRLEKQLSDLEQSQKTPEQLIDELKAKIAELS